MYQQQIIGQTTPQPFNPLLSPIQQARTSGQVIEYKPSAIKPKKQKKEIIKILTPEPKKLLFINYHT